jgi:serine/threonine protein kinase
MSKTKPAALPVDTLIGGYRVVRKLSVGGFGVVYLAKDKADGWVAIKEYLPSSLVTRQEGELLPSVAEDKLPLYWLGLKSFFEEGRSLAQISHPSVVSVQNFFRANETIYMVMNYLQGASLQEFILTARDLKREKIFRESTIRSLFDEVMHGLRIVHQSKMLHLDIKPANLMITNNNKAVLIDFGAARQVIHKKQDASMRPMYTPGFAAPEMYQRDGALGPWTDIYAIGACIFACMNGYPPVDAAARQSKDKLNLVLARMRGVYSDNLIEIVEWCMALDPQARPQSVFALQKQLSDVSALRYQSLGFSGRLRAGLGRLLP